MSQRLPQESSLLYGCTPTPRSHTGIAALVCALAVISALPAKAADSFEITVVSNPTGKISGGNALVRVDVPNGVPIDQITFKLNGQDVTAGLHPDPSLHALTGLVKGLHLGQNWFEVFSGGDAPSARLSVTNFPITGPVFSRPSPAAVHLRNGKIQTPGRNPPRPSCRCRLFGENGGESCIPSGERRSKP